MHADILYALKFFNQHIPHKNWFIAGGCAASDIFNDIDIYFHSMEDYTAAISIIPKIEYSTNNGVTFDLAIEHYINRPSAKCTIQFIKRHVGDHVSVVESFDLNKSRAVIFPDGSRYYHPSFSLRLHFDLLSLNKDTITRFAKYIADKHFTPAPRMLPIFTGLLRESFIEVEDYYKDEQVKVKISPYTQLLTYNQSPETLQFAYTAIETLPPDLRMLRYLYLFTCWSHAQPPRDDSLSTEHLYAYSKIYSLPHHQRVINENPEYLL
ncbi:MAG: hypothetical protein EOM36_04285 [Bacteroidia bacterium]|nr:hypothetical protein [Bacteroidia bacterium]